MGQTLAANQVPFRVKNREATLSVYEEEGGGREVPTRCRMKDAARMGLKGKANSTADSAE